MTGYPDHMWVVLSRRPQDTEWRPFGLPHPYDDARERRDRCQQRFPDQEWRLELEATWKPRK